MATPIPTGPACVLQYQPDEMWNNIENELGGLAQPLWFAGIACVNDVWDSIYMFENNDGNYDVVQPVLNSEQDDTQLLRWTASPKGAHVDGDEPYLKHVPAVIRLSHNNSRLSVSPGSLPKGSFPMEYDMCVVDDIAAIRLSERSVSLFNPKSDGNAANTIAKDIPYVNAAIKTLAKIDIGESKILVLRKLTANSKIVWNLAIIASELGVFGITQNVVPAWLDYSPTLIVFDENMRTCKQVVSNNMTLFDIVKDVKTFSFIEDKREVLSTNEPSRIKRLKHWFTDKV